MKRSGCSVDSTSKPAPPNDITRKPGPGTHECVLNLGSNRKAGVHGVRKKPRGQSTLVVLPPTPKLNLLDGEKLDCNGKPSTAPVEMGAPHLLLDGL